MNQRPEDKNLIEELQKQLADLKAENERLTTENKEATRFDPSRMVDVDRERDIDFGTAEIEAVAAVLKRRYITNPEGRDYEAYLQAFSKLAERPTLCPFSNPREALARVFVRA